MSHATNTPGDSPRAEDASGPPGAAGPAAPSQPIALLLPALFGLTIAAQLVSLAFGRADEELRFAQIALPSVLFLSVLTLPLAGIGIALGRQIGLGAPLLAAVLARAPGAVGKLKRDTLLAALSGLAVGGLLLLLRTITGPYLPPELPAFGHRGAIGGLAVSLGAAVAEEVWFRLGLMTPLVWLVTRVTGDRVVRPQVAWPVIVVTSLAFAMAHLPQLASYGAGSSFAVAGTILGNSIVGTLYGWCYWRRSLVAAMVAHFAVDVVLHVVPALA